MKVKGTLTQEKTVKILSLHKYTEEFIITPFCFSDIKKHKMLKREA